MNAEAYAPAEDCSKTINTWKTCFNLTERELEQRTEEDDTLRNSSVI